MQPRQEQLQELKEALGQGIIMTPPSVVQLFTTAPTGGKRNCKESWCPGDEDEERVSPGGHNEEGRSGEIHLSWEGVGARG